MWQPEFPHTFSRLTKTEIPLAFPFPCVTMLRLAPRSCFITGLASLDGSFSRSFLCTSGPKPGYETASSL
jgi:hypothetical protein